MKIRTAVLPVAGWGTRFLPATKAVPKELLPIVDRPAIQYAIEEAVASGIERVILVTSEHKRAIEDHFDISADLEAVLEQRGDIEHLRAVRAVADMVHLVTIRQKEQLGLGHAVLMAQDAVGHEPFAVMLPDDLVFGATPALAELIEAYVTTQASVVGVMRVAPAETHRYGIVDPDTTLPTSDQGRTIPLRGVVEKPDAANAPSDLAVVGRYILSPKIFERLEQTTHGVNGEIQLTDAIHTLAQEQPVVARHFSGTRYDVGSPEGWLRANLHVALDHPVYGPIVRRAVATENERPT
jgi:UTP--glucose-1-phosphate uridylyltransferase